MKKIKWIFMFYAVLATISIMAIGVFIGEQSILGILLAIVALIIIMGLGFTKKKQLRERGQL
ncbi:YlaF family protein [Priestia koreensis]|uniref:YlaF family protein n=1 Tax=Priestia koreensis TaxID=284581 RepID=UPI001F57C90D|nr:YlaF family protein [Priestia koreensis]UNL85982.1 YlaF family protein [Priestia koreensis]